MNIADLIMALRQGGDPNAAIMAATSNPDPSPAPAVPPAGPPGIPPSLAGLTTPSPAGPAPAPAAPPPPERPVGAATPITDPMKPEETPRIIKSPPDLSNMYLQLVKDNQNAQALDRNMSLIAAGFSKYPETRSALISRAGRGQGGDTPSAADFINLQKQQVANQALAVRQAAKGSLMKQYGLSRDTVDYLDASDKLDEVIKHRETGTLQVVTNAENGQVSLYNSNTHKKITDIGGPKPEEGEYVDTPEGRRLMSKRTGQPMGPAVGADPESLTPVKTESGETIMVGTKSGKPVAEIGGPKVLNADDKDNLANINKERQTAGKPLMTTEEFLTTVKRGPGVHVNVGTDGTTYPTPKQGFDYLRYPPGHPQAGKVQIGADGKPVQYAIEGGTGAAEKVEIEARAAKGTREEQEAQEKKNKAQWQQIRSASSVLNAADRALELVHSPGATGFGSKLSRAVSPGGLPSDSYDAQLSTLDANTAIAELQRMREASPTGGAIGNVTDFEQKMLASTISNVRSAQKSQDAEKSLIRIKAMFKTLVENRFDDKVDRESPAKFESALKKNIDEMSVEHANKNKAGTRTFKNIERIE